MEIKFEELFVDFGTYYVVCVVADDRKQCVRLDTKFRNAKPKKADINGAKKKLLRWVIEHVL